MEAQDTHKKEVIVLLLIVFTGLALRLYNIDQSFWWNEVNDTLTFAGADTLRQTVTRIGHFFNNHILYSVLCRLSMAIFGNTEIAARLPALLMGVASVVLLYRFGRKQSGPEQGLIAAYLLTISAIHINHSIEARGYTGFALFALLSSLSLIKALRTNARRMWFCFILFTVLGVYMHLFMVFVVAAQLVYVMILQAGCLVGRKDLLRFKNFNYFYLYSFISALIAMLLYSPIILRFIKNSDRIDHYSLQIQRYAAPGHDSVWPIIGDMANALLPGITAPVGGTVYAVFFFAGLLYLWRKNFNLALYIVILFSLPLALFLLVEPTFLTARYFLYCLPFVFLVFACGITCLLGLITKRKVVRMLCLVVILAGISIIQAPETLKAVGHDRQNYREAVQYVYKHMQSPQKTALISIGYGSTYFNYYAKTTIVRPETLEEFNQLLQANTYVWCLISAWLPEVRPPLGDKTLYREIPEHEKIYAHVTKNFSLVKSFRSEMPTHVYFFERR